MERELDTPKAEQLRKDTLVANERKHKDQRVWQLISDVPRLPMVPAYICAILNFFLSGVGTIVSGLIETPGKFNFTQIVVGFGQMWLGFFLFGWFWSLYWAFLLVSRAGQRHETLKLLSNNGKSLGSAAFNNPHEFD